MYLRYRLMSGHILKTIISERVGSRHIDHSIVRSIDKLNIILQISIKLILMSLSYIAYKKCGDLLFYNKENLMSYVNRYYS